MSILLLYLVISEVKIINGTWYTFYEEKGFHKTSKCDPWALTTSFSNSHYETKQKQKQNQSTPQLFLPVNIKFKCIIHVKKFKFSCEIPKEIFTFSK